MKSLGYGMVMTSTQVDENAQHFTFSSFATSSPAARANLRLRIYSITVYPQSKLNPFSTQVDENAQHFYRKLNYQDAGGLIINIPEYRQPMEMFFIKAMQQEPIFDYEYIP